MTLDRKTLFEMHIVNVFLKFNISLQIQTDFNFALDLMEIGKVIG